MLDTLTDADWAALRAERYAPRDGAQPSLFDGPIVRAPTEQGEATAADQAAPPPAPAERYIETTEGWL